MNHHRILCGDFNSPIQEMADGQIRTSGQITPGPDGRYIMNKWWRIKQGRRFPEERWDMAERQVLQGLRRYDLSDVFRAKHPYGHDEFSYYTNNRGKRNGLRLDHIFASHLLEVVDCKYLHDLRRVKKLSHHAPIEAVFAPKTPL